MILALDPSLSCIGWAVMPLDAGRVIEYGTYKPKGDAMDRKLIDAYRWLCWLFDDSYHNKGEAFTTFAFEVPVVYRNPATAIKLAQLVGVLRVAAFEWVEQTVEINPGGRLAAFGLPVNLKRAVAKERVIAHVNTRYGLALKAKNDNEADAIAVGIAASRKLKLAQE